MVNEFKIPIENKKPIETVYEIKDEYKVPSFEEFMKDYQTDEKVNDSYADELKSYGDIGINKSYGPGWPGDGGSSNLQPDSNGEWEYLEIPCVSKTCSVNDKVPRQWYHDSAECLSYSQRMSWSTKARIKCSYCNMPSHISNWSFKCHRCPKYGDYDKTKFLKAIRIAHEVEKVNKNFASKLFEYMADNESEFN